MTTPHVIGIGNAIVDVIARADDHFLEHMGIEKGIMQLVERERAELLYASMGERTETPGGSVANTIAGLGKLGLQSSFIGKVKGDSLGRSYAEGMEADGIAFPNAPVADAPLPTSRSMIFVSPDGERSMNTYLGAGADLGADDVPEAPFAKGGFVFLEGYLFDKDEGKTAFRRAAELMHRAGGEAGITLSDPFCTERHREDFKALIAGEMDVVIGNEKEWTTLYETDLDSALGLAAEACRTVVCTRSGEAVVILKDGARVEVPVTRIVPVDATGAGDQFAAGFLYGYVGGRDSETCGRMGVAAASEVISHIGPRPEADMMTRFRELGLV
ncbi:Sugar or nucleoside kinase, ribokinase family [Palleronia marisminoris]|uniref:5-dehydro-2-deoxygluconokinase n=1 Tax=Palleronia marisminoris TaxID=315423 RepID=A0A1Y5RVI1_9RHOB|nr:adenosine kinase [Palleronia marisminoris]SFG44560.1 Sugar or nucleoside kinase, ribokinase family [Palleronia marisminoris]SLN26527.1 5-dehydro-2-deoxygluconokinase [Palleronia marisminoris]